MKMPFAISQTVWTTWGIMAALGVASWLTTRRLQMTPGRWQTAVEGVVAALEGGVEGVVGDQTRRVLPFVGTLWVFLLVANLIGIVPGLRSPTDDLSLTSALAVLVFVSVHWYGIQVRGLKNYLKHYVQPNPILLPFHIVGEISRTVALAVRLFGNVFSLETAALLVLAVAGFLVPVPLLALHLIEAVVQAYIFGILALIYIGAAIQVQESEARKEEKA
jgi:F-type H+-transporting ATPase subunit a